MKNIKTVVMRDLGAYFTSPIGYIFMVVFLALSVGLFMTAFFTFPVADMRSFFANLPIILCVFIPAVTMRVWAEERKENTWELLLTFPMRARELVLGKFAAALVFYLLTLAATFTLPLMLFVLGNPDTGMVFGGYLGATLLGAMFLAMGLFFSGFCKDQIVAFVVTLLACFGVFLLGTNFIAGYIDGFFPGVGSTLSQLVGVIDHYNAFIRGVVEMGDVLYFVAWTTLFLVLNAMYIEGRNRPGMRMQFSAAIVLCVGIGLAFNWLTIGASLYRFDLTEDKIYTVSPATKSILADLNRPVQVNLYITPRSDMPTAYRQLEQDIVGKLDELRIASGGMVEPNVVYLQAANVMATAPAFGEEDEPQDQVEKVERRMLEKGVEPFGVQVMSGDEISHRLVYSSIGVGLGAEAEEIVPQVTPETLQQLEYRLVNIIYKLTREKTSVVALVAPTETFAMDPQMRQIMMQMGQPIPEQRDPYDLLQAYLESEKYEVRRVELTKDSPLPDEYDTLAVINPRELNERQRWEINRALASGKPVLLAVQNYLWDYQTSSRGITMTRRDENPQINPLLAQYGLGVDDNLLLDVNSFPLTIRSNNPLESLLGGGTPINSPMHIEVTSEQMDSETSITSRLGFITYLWGTALTLDEEELKKHGLDARIIMHTSRNAWTVPQHAQLTQETFNAPPSGDQFPLMALVTGQFPDAYSGQERPDWPPPQPQQPGMPPPPPDDGEEPPAQPLTPEPGKLVLIGASQMFRSDFLQRSNADLFLNSIDAITLGDELVNVRSRKPVDRTISRPSDRQTSFWRFVNYVLVNLSIVTLGVVVAVVRRQSRNAYTMSFMNDGGSAE